MYTFYILKVRELVCVIIQKYFTCVCTHHEKDHITRFQLYHIICAP